MLKPESIVIHNPHSSLCIPERFRPAFLLTESALQAELLLLTDRYVDELFAVPDLAMHTNTVSRLVMDPERFRRDEDEPMARKGMGFAYIRTTGGEVLRHLPATEKEWILENLYDPYHAHLTRMVDGSLEASGKCLIIDAHSFPSLPLPCDIDQTSKRPDICLGFDNFHIDGRLLDQAHTYFTGLGLSIADNVPYAGAMVPMKHYRQDARVQSLMIEVNRSLYMDETTGQKNDRFDTIRMQIQSYLSGLSRKS